MWLLITAAFELNCTIRVKRDIKIKCDSVGGDIDKDSITCIRFYDEELRSQEKC